MKKLIFMIFLVTLSFSSYASKDCNKKKAMEKTKEYLTTWSSFPPEVYEISNLRMGSPVEIGDKLSVVFSYEMLSRDASLGDYSGFIIFDSNTCEETRSGIASLENI